MHDMEEVVNGLEWILEDDRFGFGVNWENGKPRDDHEKAGKIITDAIALLKEQRKIGHWIDSAGDEKCSVCGATYSDLYPDYHRTHFCPNCGAKMEVDLDA